VLEEFIESPLTPLSVKYAWERSGMVLYDISKISGGCTIWRNISTENSRHCQCDSGSLGWCHNLTFKVFSTTARLGMHTKNFNTFNDGTHKKDDCTDHYRRCLWMNSDGFC
jgi:hypothetical protein